jgi:hypothetical protein
MSLNVSYVVVLEKCLFLLCSYFLDLFGLFWINGEKNAQVS